LINLIQYVEGQTRKVHLHAGNKPWQLSPHTRSRTACGRELGVTLRRYKIWRGHPEEVDCELCKGKL
jgi:hypothetical protein